MGSGYSGLDHLWEHWQQQHIISTSWEQQQLKHWDHSEATQPTKNTLLQNMVCFIRISKQNKRRRKNILICFFFGVQCLCSLSLSLSLSLPSLSFSFFFFLEFLFTTIVILGYEVNYWVLESMCMDYYYYYYYYYYYCFFCLMLNTGQWTPLFLLGISLHFLSVFAEFF